MTGATRRDVLAAAGLAIGSGAVSGHASSLDATSGSARVADDLSRYIAFGDKASGGAGDNACGEWLQSELESGGFTVRRQFFSAPFFAPTRTVLTSGTAVAEVTPQAIVVPTRAGGVTGPLVRLAPGSTGRDNTLNGAIAIIDLPYARWSSALAKPIAETVKIAFARGASSAVVITNGPSAKACALNAGGDAPMFDRPVVVLAPDEAQPFLAAASIGEAATLRVEGTGGRRPAFNLVGTLDNRRARWIVVSTPRSGWFGCAGERGPGVAVWLALARWAKAALGGFNVVFVCNSGHEYENLGAEHTAQGKLPLPADTAFWYHLGANVAALDWQELTGTLLPLPSADPQRYLVVSPSLIDVAGSAFAGQPGLEAPYPTGGITAGELTSVIAAGYTNVAGIFGAHRYHHTREDDARCVDSKLVAAAIEASKKILRTIDV